MLNRQHTSDRSLHPRSAFHRLDKKPQGPPLKTRGKLSERSPGRNGDGPGILEVTDFFVFSRACSQVIRPIRISNRSDTSCRLPTPVTLVYFPESPGRLCANLPARVRRMKRELSQLYGPHHHSFSSAVVAAHARVRSVLPDMCRGLYEAGGASRHRCILLDLSSTFDRLPFCPHCDKAVFDFRVRGSIRLSGMDRGT